MTRACAPSSPRWARAAAQHQRDVGGGCWAGRRPGRRHGAARRSAAAVPCRPPARLPAHQPPLSRATAAARRQLGASASAQGMSHPLCPPRKSSRSHICSTRPIPPSAVRHDHQRQGHVRPRWQVARLWLCVLREPRGGHARGDRDERAHGQGQAHLRGAGPGAGRRGRAGTLWVPWALAGCGWAGGRWGRGPRRVGSTLHYCVLAGWRRRQTGGPPALALARRRGGLCTAPPAPRLTRPPRRRPSRPAPQRRDVRRAQLEQQYQQRMAMAPGPRGPMGPGMFPPGG